MAEYLSVRCTTLPINVINKDRPVEVRIIYEPAHYRLSVRPEKNVDLDGALDLLRMAVNNERICTHGNRNGID